MAALGTFLLLASFVVYTYAATASVVGARRRSARLVESSTGAVYLAAALLTLASAVMVHAFVVGDYSIRYVQRYSDSAQPLFYKLTSYWGGLDGSIMFWVFLLAVSSALAVRTNRERHRELLPYVVAILSSVAMFFLLVMIIHKNPFATFLTEAPTEGRGLNPLLQNPYMAIHPPSLYAGFVGMTIPFAFGLAALITGQLDDAWLRAVRRWTMTAWLFLSLGLTLGMIWAYEELGWGGFWGWDPVENAGLLPWFTATAFLHSVMVQERRSMLRVWNVTLVIVTFLLTLFATFMTRTGIVQSVHAFGEDRTLAWMFIAFMGLVAAFSFGWVIYRLPLLRARHELDSWASREAAFLLNNWVLLFAAFFVLFATMFPTLSEAVTGERLTVGPPFFNKWMKPVGLLLLFLTGVGPLLAWRKTSLANLRWQFTWPVLVGAATGGALAAGGFRVWSSGVCFALSAFVATTIVQEFLRGALVRRRSTGTDLLTALVGLVARNKRRYGGYIVHFGIVLVFLGFAGQGYKLEEQVVLKRGQQVVIGGYTLRHEGVRVADDGHKQMVTAEVAVLEAQREIARLRPARWYFRGREEEPTTEVAIRRSPGEDLYVVMAAFELADQTATFQVTINPLVNWIWVGFGVLAVGTGIALLPETVFSFALARVPAAATTAGLLVTLGLQGLAPVAAAAQQHVESSEVVAVVPQNPLEKRLQRELVCLCGTCGKKNLAECTCGVAANLRAELAGQVAQGKTREEIIAYFVARYGSQEVLGAPIDRGFNRLAWLLPYIVGLTGAVGVALVALRWSRRSAPPGREIAEIDPRLEARLDDELRDLD